ncbi:undecaprenyl-diphosphatase, partial [Neobacillus niacini]
MDQRLFRAINNFTGHFRFLDVFMIIISKKLRYLFAFILIIMWFQNNFHKRIASLAGISAIITFL